MLRTFARRAVVLLFVACAVPWPALGQQAAPVSAEIRIGLPQGIPEGVRVTPGSDTIRLELPRGSDFPSDFAASSGGLLRNGSHEIINDGQRVRLDLSLGRGVLSEVRFDTGVLVLRFESGMLEPLDGIDASEQYRLGPDDQIRIVVFNHPDLTAEVSISREGMVSAPLVSDIKAAGLTRRELAARLNTMLEEFLVDPRVDVELLEYKSQWVMVAGEVRKPGRVALRGGTRLKEILGESLGFKEEAGEEIQITRRNERTGQSEMLRVRRSDFESGAENPLMHHGDIVEVVRARYCYVQGQVNSPGRVRVERGMTLMRVIAMAGGLSDFASRKKVQVMDEQGGSGIRSFDLNKIEKRRAEDPPIRGGEVVIVRKRIL